MKTFYIFSFLILSFIFLSSASLYSQNNVYSANDTNITVNTGDVFAISLESNQTTGYSWSVAESQDNAKLSILNMEYMQKPNEGKVVGTGGVEVWRFKAISSGTVKLNFYYSRSWEKDQTAAKTIVYSVTIK